MTGEALGHQSASSSSLTAGDELAQLLVEGVVDPGVLVALEQLLPLVGGRPVGRHGAALLPGHVGLRAEERAHEHPVLEVRERVVGGEEHPTRALLTDGVHRELLLAHPDPAGEDVEHPQELEVEHELLVRGGEAALQPPGGVHHEVAAADHRRPQRVGRLGRRLEVEGVRRAQAAAAAVRQPVAAGEEAAGEGAEDRLGRPERGAAGAHVDRGEERPEEARSARAHGLDEGDAREGLGHLLGEPGGDADGCRGAREQKRRDDHRLAGDRPLHEGVGHEAVPHERAVGVDDTHDRGRLLDRLAPAERDRGQLDGVASLRAGRPVADERLVRPSQDGVVHVHVARALVEVAGLDRAALLARHEVGGVRHLDQLEVVGDRALAAAALEVGAERRPADGREHRLRPADPDRPGGVPGPERERRRCAPGHLHHELAVPADALAVDVLAQPREQGQSALVADVRPDLLEDGHGVLVDGVERLAREHGRDAGVSEHRRRAYRIA